MHTMDSTHTTLEYYVRDSKSLQLSVVRASIYIYIYNTYILRGALLRLARVIVLASTTQSIRLLEDAYYAY